MHTIVIQAWNAIKERMPYTPRLALVLGSGAGELVEKLSIDTSLEYKDLSGFPVPTVPGHRGRFLFSKIEGIPVVLMQGRVHYYEGWSSKEVVLPIRLMRAMGAEVLFLTNAAGSANPTYRKGEFMIIKDHISIHIPSPLTGPLEKDMGPRFPDMTEVYDRTLADCLRQAGQEEGIRMQEGVYMQFAGPNFETPAEVRMAHILGADAVGMSTAVEAIAAHAMGMRVMGLSLISNEGAGISDAPLSAEEVNKTGEIKEEEYFRLVLATLRKIKKYL